jgi:hypothetical protein
MNLSPMEKSWRWARIAGALIVPFSIFFLSYGLYTFLWRDRYASIKTQQRWNPQISRLILVDTQHVIAASGHSGRCSYLHVLILAG